MPSQPSKDLVALPNPHPERDYEVQCVCPEFTCVCPLTGQPDFATFTISYVPGPRIVELKSLKLYLWSFRDRPVFAEALAAEIAGEIFESAKAISVDVTITQRPRGGITVSATARRATAGP
jgi:7-cyano-7-deazaguanine reductase